MKSILIVGMVVLLMAGYAYTQFDYRQVPGGGTRTIWTPNDSGFSYWMDQDGRGGTIWTPPGGGGFSYEYETQGPYKSYDPQRRSR